MVSILFIEVERVSLLFLISKEHGCLLISRYIFHDTTFWNIWKEWKGIFHYLIFCKNVLLVDVFDDDVVDFIFVFYFDYPWYK